MPVPAGSSWPGSAAEKRAGAKSASGRPRTAACSSTHAISFVSPRAQASWPHRRSSGAARFCSAPVETSAVRVSFSRTVAGSVRSLLSAPAPSAFSRDQPELPRRLSDAIKIEPRAARAPLASPTLLRSHLIFDSLHPLHVRWLDPPSFCASSPTGRTAALHARPRSSTHLGSHRRCQRSQRPRVPGGEIRPRAPKAQSTEDRRSCVHRRWPHGTRRRGQTASAAPSLSSRHEDRVVSRRP